MATYNGKLRGQRPRDDDPPRRAVLGIWIPLPPLDEQRRIAAILDHADALRAKRRQVLAHLDTLTQSIFHDMFGDPRPGIEQLAPVMSSAHVADGRSNSRRRPASTRRVCRVLKTQATLR